MYSSSAPSIMLVEDDVRLADLVRRYLETSGFKVLIAELSRDVSDQIIALSPDLVVLDLGLPRQDGLGICKKLRPAFQRPILILTARNSDSDQVLGLELGADDYVMKPVDPRVLVARINALLRRSPAINEHHQAEWQIGGLHVNSVTRSITVHGQPVDLSTTEFDLLLQLVMHAGQIQSRESLYRQLYRRDYDGTDRLLDVRVSHLRKKLGDDVESAPRIKTIWGKGYMLIPKAW